MMKKILTVGLCILVLMSLVGCAKTDEQLVDQGYDSIKKDPDKAIELFEEVLDNDDENIDAYLGLMEVYSREEAYKELEKTMEDIFDIFDEIDEDDLEDIYEDMEDYAEDILDEEDEMGRWYEEFIAYFSSNDDDDETTSTEEATATEEQEETAVIEETTEETTEVEETAVVEELVEEVNNGPVVFNWNIGSEPSTIDPGLNGASDGGDVINQTFEGLVREKSGVVYPGMAEEWSTSADGLTVTFHLRDNLKWSDGSDLTADDFVYSWLRGMDPNTDSSYSWIWAYTNVVGADDYTTGYGSASSVGISAPNDTTFVVELIQPTDYFVSLTSFYHFMPVKQSAVEASGGSDGTWASNPNRVVSNGPFVLTSYNTSDKLSLEKNPYYWNVDDVGIDTINGYFIESSTTAYLAYQAGELDFLSSVPAAEIQHLSAEDSEFYVFPLLGTYYYNFNMDLEIWSDPLVRQAMSMAVDRQAICETLGTGNVPAPGFISQGFLDNRGREFFETAGSYGLSVTAEVGAAQAKLAEAGYPGGEGFPSFTLLYNTSETHRVVAEMIQADLKTNLGIDCTLESQEWNEYKVTRTAGDFEMARGGWLTDFMDPSGMLAIFQEGNAFNDSNYYNEAYEAAMADAASTNDPGEHYASLYEAYEILMTDMPFIPIYHYADTMLAAGYLVDWDRSVLGIIDFTSATIEQ